MWLIQVIFVFKINEKWKTRQLNANWVFSWATEKKSRDLKNQKLLEKQWNIFLKLFVYNVKNVNLIVKKLSSGVPDVTWSIIAAKAVKTKIEEIIRKIVSKLNSTSKCWTIPEKTK